MRKIASIREILSIEPIEGADRIEKVTIDGWNVVSQKGIHRVGDKIVYIEIDGFLPESDLRFESFMKFGTRTFNGVRGHRVRTVRLKGVYSQGGILPLSEFPELNQSSLEDDVSEIIGVVKWEAPEVGQSAGKFGDVKGNFPWFLRKSDQERIQNLYGKLKYKYSDEQFVGTLKMDGSSITVFHVMGDKYDNRGFGICSRNMELKFDETLNFEDQGCFIKGALNSDLFSKVKQLSEIYGGNWAVQGELVGMGIQGTFEGFTEYQVFAYNIFDIDNQEYVNYNTFREMAKSVNLTIVPEIYTETKILKTELQDILQLSDGTSIINPVREGIVWKQLNGNIQFKAISNKYLEKQR